jgi:hypothetical protein
MERLPILYQNLPARGSRRAKRKLTGATFIFLFALIGLPIKLLVSDERGRPFKDALIDALISSAVYFTLAALLAAWEQRKSEQRLTPLPQP